MIPRQPALHTFLFRLFGTIGGSIIGTLILSAIFFLALSAFSNESSETFSLYIILAIILIGTLTTNVITPFFISLTDKDRYDKPVTILTQAFILNLIIFFVSVPIYTFISIIEPEILNYIAAFHFILTAILSALLTEILSKKQFVLVGIYGVAFGTLVSFTIISILFVTGKQTFIMFIIFPLLWITIECFRSLTETLYYFYYKLFGIEALDTDTSFEPMEKEKE